MPVDNPATEAPADRRAPAPKPGDTLAIQVAGLEKSFRIPTHRVDSFKERLVRPFAAREYRELQALKGISFDVRRGEFFGIVGRNGSGKSTLLKLLASIYRPDAGRIRMAGRLAPFIELGVGFNMELTARENVVLNGVMMGLTPGETRRRLDAVIEFAELEEFAELKLKNYSSGMLVRLAFSVVVEAVETQAVVSSSSLPHAAAPRERIAVAARARRLRLDVMTGVLHERGARARERVRDPEARRPVPMVRRPFGEVAVAQPVGRGELGQYRRVPRLLEPPEAAEAAHPGLRLRWKETGELLESDRSHGRILQHVGDVSDAL